jgi:ribA/ribD-fused uncharacterized protein
MGAPALVAILGILAAVAIPAFLKYIKRSKPTAAAEANICTERCVGCGKAQTVACADQFCSTCAVDGTEFTLRGGYRPLYAVGVAAATPDFLQALEAAWTRSPAEFLAGPGFLPLAFVLGIIFFALANAVGKKVEQKVNKSNEWRLYSGPFVRHTTGQWTAIDTADTTADTAEASDMGQEAEQNNEIGESAPVEQGESPKEEGMNAFFAASNQMLAKIIEAVRSGVRSKADSRRDHRLDTYGGYLRRADTGRTILTILAGDEVRETEIFTLGGEAKSSTEDLDLPDHWLEERDGFTLVLRGGQIFRFKTEHFLLLCEELKIAPQATAKVVSLEEVDKYLGTVLWAAAAVTGFRKESAMVMAKEVAPFYDGTNYATAKLARGIRTSARSWVGYAIRRLLTSLGLFKGMIIVIRDGYLPKGIEFLASEVKPHLTLRQEKGLAIAAQPQGDAHSDEAGTASLQMWMALMGKFVAGKRFAAFMADSYAGMVAKLPEVLGKNSRPVAEEVETRDLLLREAARQHGFSAVAVFRTAAKAMAESLSRGFDPFTVNVVPRTADGKSLMVTGYPLMLPWMAFASAWKQAGQEVPADIAAKVARMEEVRKQLFKMAGPGVLPILVEGWKHLSMADKAKMLKAIATRIPTGKTSGVKVLLIDAEPYMDLIPEMVGAAKEARFWLFPCEETNRFKELSEGGDDDDVYYFLLENLADLAEEGIAERERLLILSEADKADMATLAKAIEARAAKYYHADIDANGEVVFRRGAAYGDAVKAVDAMMALPHANDWAKMLPNSHFKFSKKKEQWYVFAPKLAMERVIRMTEAEREILSKQTDIFVAALQASNDSPFTAAIGTVAQGHKFAFGILGGIVTLPPELQRWARAWALLIVGTILLSDMVDAANKGKGFKKADEALKLLNLLWWWLTMYMAKNPEARIVAPKQFLRTVPPHAKKLFEKAIVQPEPGQPGHLLAEPYRLFAELAEEVERATRDEFERKEWCETQALMAEDAAEKVTAQSAAQIAAEVWKAEWRDSGEAKRYTEALAKHGAAVASGKYKNLRDEQAALQAIREILLSTHARFDAAVVKVLLEANVADVELAFKKVKLALVYNEGFKYLDSPENAIRIMVDKTSGNEFDAIGGVPSTVLVTSGESKQGPFTGGSEILVEWMTAATTLVRQAGKKSKSGIGRVVISVKSEGFNAKDEDGKRSLALSDEDFMGKTILEALAIPGASLAGSSKEENHPYQDRWVAGLADDLAIKREALRKRFMQKGKDSAELKELLAHNTAELLARVGLADKLTAAIAGTVVKATIQTYDWLDAKRQAHASYPNTFIILTFGEAAPEAEKEEVKEAVVCTAPAAPRGPTGNLQAKLARLLPKSEKTEAKAEAPAAEEDVPWYTDEEFEAIQAAKQSSEPVVAEAPVAPAAAAPGRFYGAYSPSKKAIRIAEDLEGAEKAAVVFHEAGHMAHDLTAPSVKIEAKLSLMQEAVANFVGIALMKNSNVAGLVADVKARMAARYAEVSAAGNYEDNADKAPALAREIVAKLNADANIVAQISEQLKKFGYVLNNGNGGGNGGGGEKAEESPAKDFAIAGHKYQEACQENGEYSEALAAKILLPGTELILKREANNPKDSNAIALHIWEEETPDDKIGYVPRELAKTLAPQLDEHGHAIYAIVTCWDSGWPRFTLKKSTYSKVFQGRKSKADDGRYFQWWTNDIREAADYGSYTSIAVVDTAGMLNARTDKGAKVYMDLRSEYKQANGYWFDVCDNNTEAHCGFFAFLESKGYTGLNLVGNVDNNYVVTFGKAAVVSRDDSRDPYPSNSASKRSPLAVAFTGHRPNKIGGYDANSPKRQWVKQQIRQELAKLEVTHPEGLSVITGGAIGVDQDAALIAADMGIPYIVIAPCKGQDAMWPADAKRQYKEILENAAYVEYVSEKTYNEDKGCMNRRNIVMVDSCDVLIAVYDGSEGGTAHAVNYAKKREVEIIHINPNNFEPQETADKHQKNGFQKTFLSNFWPVEITYQGLTYPSVENFYQAMKTSDKAKRQIFTTVTAANAKKRGRSLPLQENWEELKVAVMTYGLRAKFAAGSDLARQLLLTENAELVEYNYWHDNFWGNCTCSKCSNTKGENKLGQILMQVRDELRGKKNTMPIAVYSKKDAASIPTDAVYVGRPTKWGNPFVIGQDGDRDEVVAKYEAWVVTQPDLMAALGELKGKNLVCWCAPSACHADVLMRLANS